jgi:hypothetical protein
MVTEEMYEEIWRRKHQILKTHNNNIKINEGEMQV